MKHWISYQIRKIDSHETPNKHRLLFKYITTPCNMYISFLVTCYEGFYCANTTKSTPKRCPLGTFSYKNASSIEDCFSCPTEENDRKKWMKRKGSKRKANFMTNCRSSPLTQSKNAFLNCKVNNKRHTSFVNQNLAIYKLQWTSSLYTTHI